jgi:membrane associated rhomboid family serine protease
MSNCDACGKQENMPYQCRHCGGTFCAEHRLPENHDCPGLAEWDDPGGVFDSGFDDSVEDRGGSGGGIGARLGGLTQTGGTLGYFRGNMTYVFLGAMWITFALQYLVFPALGYPRLSPTWSAAFTISPVHPEYVWTWVTSIFSHGGLYHIAGNSIVIYFFGQQVERYIGSRDFTLLFLGSGVLAGLGRIAIQMAQSETVGALGASGAALAIMAVLTVLNPKLRVILLIPPVPVPIWIITGFYALLSITGVMGGIGGGIAHGAHGVGLLIGLVYGYRVKSRISTPSKMQMGRGRGPGGPGGPGGRGPF